MIETIVRVAFIGCGRVAVSHFDAIRQCEGARLMGVYDRDESHARVMAVEWETTYLSIEEIICSADIDAVYVLTPMESHYQYAKQALEHGKHVLIEKPVGDDIKGIHELIRLSESTGKVCMPGHSYLYLTEISRMRKLAVQGKIGIPTSMFMSEIYRMPDELARKYHGPTVEVLCHQIYIMLALLGVPRRVQAFAGCFRQELIPTGDEQVMVNAEFDNGALAHLFISWAGHDETSEPWTFKLKLLGTNGGMHFSRRDQVYGTPTEQREQYLYDEMFEMETDYFINKCILRGEQPLSTMEDAAKAMTILKAVQMSAQNRTVETLQFK